MDEDDLREFELALDRHGALSGQDSQRLVDEVRRLHRQNGEALLRFQDALTVHSAARPADWRSAALQMAKALAGDSGEEARRAEVFPGGELPL